MFGPANPDNLCEIMFFIGKVGTKLNVFVIFLKTGLGDGSGINWRSSWDTSSVLSRILSINSTGLTSSYDYYLISWIIASSNFLWLFLTVSPLLDDFFDNVEEGVTKSLKDYIFFFPKPAAEVLSFGLIVSFNLYYVFFYEL